MDTMGLDVRENVAAVLTTARVTVQTVYVRMGVNLVTKEICAKMVSILILQKISTEKKMKVQISIEHYHTI